MLLYTIRRLIYTLPILFGVTLLTFLLFHVVGGDPAYQLAGKNPTAEQLEVIRDQLGTNKSLFIQYTEFLQQVATFDFGRSWTSQQKISEMISQGIGPSLSLTVPAFFLAFVICLFFALTSSYYQGRWLDRGLITFCLSLMSISFLVYIIFFQYFFAYYLGLFPVSGWEPDFWQRWAYLLLPWGILISVSLGPNILIYRTAVLDEVFQDYVRTARSKGLSEKVIYLRHILKNALIPIITIVVLQMPFLFTGSLLLESFFSIPGLGSVLINGITNSDFPVIKAMTVIGSLLYMIFNLISDLLYAVVDPRIRLQ